MRSIWWRRGGNIWRYFREKTYAAGKTIDRKKVSYDNGEASDGDRRILFWCQGKSEHNDLLMWVRGIAERSGRCGDLRIWKPRRITIFYRWKIFSEQTCFSKSICCIAVCLWFALLKQNSPVYHGRILAYLMNQNRKFV